MFGFAAPEANTPSLTVALALLFGVLAVLLTATVTTALMRRPVAALRSWFVGDVRARLIDVVEEDGDVEAHVSSLNPFQRRALEEPLKARLESRAPDGRAELVEAAEALGLGRRSLERLSSSDTDAKLDALEWLTIMQVDVPPEQVYEACGGSRRTRAAGALLLSANGRLDEGTELLLRDGEHMSVYGASALHQLNFLDPTPAVRRGSAFWRSWEPDLTVQVLEVLCRCTGTADGTAEWVAELVDAEEPAVREHALDVLVEDDLQNSSRDHLSADLVADPSPRVRSAAYRVLGEWGDGESISVLEYAASQETSEDAGLEAARQLHRLGVRPETDRAQQAYDWVDDERRILSP